MRVEYGSAAPNSLSDAMNTIITHWSAITDHGVMAGKVAVGRRDGRPMSTAERTAPLSDLAQSEV